MGLAALMFNALAARCVWHCGVLLRLLLAAPLLVLACGHALRSSQTTCCSWLPCCAALQPHFGAHQPFHLDCLRISMGPGRAPAPAARSALASPPRAHRPPPASGRPSAACAGTAPTCTRSHGRPRPSRSSRATWRGTRSFGTSPRPSRTRASRTRPRAARCRSTRLAASSAASSATCRPRAARRRANAEVVRRARAAARLCRGLRRPEARWEQRV